MSEKAASSGWQIQKTLSVEPMLDIVPEVLARAEPSLNLGITQIGVTLNEGPRGVEESGYFLVCHLIANLPAVLNLTPVMKSPYCPVT